MELMLEKRGTNQLMATFSKKVCDFYGLKEGYMLIFTDDFKIKKPKDVKKVKK